MQSQFPTFRFFWDTLGPWYTTTTQSQNLLRIIAAATEEKLPLTSLLESWAADERGVQRLRMFRLVRLLQRGVPLPEALEEVPGVLRDEDVLAVRFDSQSGTRTAAMRARLDSAPPRSTPLVSVWQTLLYFAVVVPIGLAIAVFIQASIVPKFERILGEFRVPQSDLMRCSIAAAHLAASYWWVGVLAILLLVWASFSPTAIRWLRGLMSRLFAPWRDLYAADVLQKLGVALKAGRPLAGALSTLARYHFDPTIRHKLLFVRNEVEQGADVWQSLTSVGLLTRREVTVLTTAQRVGNRPWALRELVAGKQRRTTRRWERRSILVLPVLLFATGAFVLAQALVIFQPLIDLLDTF